MRFYFDHNATTPASPEAIEAMLPVLTDAYGNASSIHHFGQIAKQRLEAARRQVAALLGAKPTEIVFVSGGTEGNNLAIRGVACRPGMHIVTSTIEHPAVLQVCQSLEAEGVAVSYVPVAASGVIDVDDVRSALRPETVLITVMHANNELGTVQPVRALAELAHEAGVIFHSDGVQAAGKLGIERTGAELYTISGHKFGAPKGVGALYVREKLKLQPLLRGGKQERERRPGTENVPGAVAMGRAAEWVRLNLEAETARIGDLRDRLERGILASVPAARVNCGSSDRTPNTTNIRFDGVEGEAMVIALDLRGFAVSSGAACSSGAVEPSHVLTAVGLSRDDARSCLRFSLGRQNDERQVDALIEAVAASAAHLRRLSPVAVG